MRIIPVQPESEHQPAAEAPEASRRTFGRKAPSRRTFGRRAPSRRTFGRRTPSRTTFGWRGKP